MALGRHADVARRANLEIELLVGPEGEIFPTVSFVLRQVTEDDGRLRRVVELVFDVFDFRDLGELGDVERALVQDDAVRPMESGGDDLDFALSVLVDDGVDLVLDAARHEYRALVAEPKRARVSDAARIDIDREPLRRLELSNWQLVGRSRNWRRRDWRKLLCAFGVGSTDQRGAGR